MTADHHVEHLAEGASEVADLDRPRRGASRLAMPVLRVVFVAVLFALWQLVSDHLVGSFWISAPTSIAVRLWDWGTGGYLLYHTESTLYAALLGLILGVSLGVVIGFVFGRLRILERVTAPLMTGLYSLPRVAIAPLFVLWFGIGLTSKVVLAATTVFFLMFFNTVAGVHDVDADLVDVTRVMGARRRDILLKVVLPSSLGWMLLGLKLSIPYALIGAVVGEIIASNRGLGYVVQHSAGQFDSTGVFAALITLMVISLALDGMAKALERQTQRWKAQAR